MSRLVLVVLGREVPSNMLMQTFPGPPALWGCFHTLRLTLLSLPPSPRGLDCPGSPVTPWQVIRRDRLWTCDGCSDPLSWALQPSVLSTLLQFVCFPLSGAAQTVCEERRGMGGSDRECQVPLPWAWSWLAPGPRGTRSAAAPGTLRSRGRGARPAEDAAQAGAFVIRQEHGPNGAAVPRPPPPWVCASWSRTGHPGIRDSCPGVPGLESTG